MVAYQDSTPPPAGSNDLDQRRSQLVSAAPTYSDVAQWKAESALFLSDVTQRLNGILAEVNQTLIAETLPRPDSVPVDGNANIGGDLLETVANANGDNRISALKERLARKLHNLEETKDFEEASDRPIQATLSAEAGR